jgi:hypothetical protein
VIGQSSSVVVTFMVAVVTGGVQAMPRRAMSLVSAGAIIVFLAVLALLVLNRSRDQCSPLWR